MVSNAHPTLTGNQTNRPTSYTDLSETSLEQAVIDIADFKDERGILINAMPVSLHIPSALRFVAERILKSSLTTRIATVDNTGSQASSGVVAAAQRNDINAVREMGIFSKGAFINHRFTDTNGWFIRTNTEDGPKMFTRIALQTGDEGDFDTGNYRYKARERYSFGFSDWRNVYGNSGA
jgi:hypothetical protein